MPTPTAEIKRDAATGFPWGRRWTASEGHTFLKSFLVDTDDMDIAITAAGLPKEMESFSVDFPNYRCVELIPSEHASKTTKVTAKFAAIGLSGWGGSGTPPPAPVPPAPDTCFTEFRCANESITLHNAINVDTGEPLPRPYSIGDGAGMPAYAGRIEVDVWVYYLPGMKPNIAYFRELHCDKCVNQEDGLVLPPTRGTTHSYTVRDKQLLYMGFRQLITPQGQSCIVHTLWWAEKHNYFWTPIRADGKSGTLADLREEPRYQQKPFAGLWTNVQPPEPGVT